MKGRVKIKATFLILCLLFSVFISTSHIQTAAKQKTSEILEVDFQLAALPSNLQEEEPSLTNNVSIMSNVSSNELSTTPQAYTSSIAEDIRTVDDIANNEVPNVFVVEYVASVDGMEIAFSFKCKFIEMLTKNAYNGTILADEIVEVFSDVKIISCILQTPDYAQRTFYEETINDDSLLNILMIDIDGEMVQLQTIVPKENMDAYKDNMKTVSENHPDMYFYCISKLRNIPKSEYVQITSEPQNLSEKFLQDDELYNIENKGDVQIRSLSSIGNEVRNIFNHDSWFYTTGFHYLEIPASRRVCTMNTILIGSTYYADCLIWQYVTGIPDFLNGDDSAHFQMTILYNITILYNNGNWNDFGADSSATAIRNSSIGVKTTGCGNNDFFQKVEQTGQYNYGDGSSPVESILVKNFFKAVPYGSYISDAIDLLSSFIDFGDVATYSSGMGTIFYDDDPEVHYEQNDGYVRSMILKSGLYSLYFANCNYQQQEAYIVNRPRSGQICENKKLVFQSHYEIIGAYGGYVSLYIGATSYVREYS